LKVFSEFENEIWTILYYDVCVPVCFFRFDIIQAF
jgi:hypothetical protein